MLWVCVYILLSMFSFKSKRLGAKICMACKDIPADVIKHYEEIVSIAGTAFLYGKLCWLKSCALPLKCTAQTNKLTQLICILDNHNLIIYSALKLQTNKALWHWRTRSTMCTSIIYMPQSFLKPAMVQWHIRDCKGRSLNRSRPYSITWHAYSSHVMVFFLFFFSVRLLSVLRGHSVFFILATTANALRFWRIFYPRFYPLHFFPILILEKEPVFSLLNVKC